MSGNIGWDDEIVLRKRSDHAKVTRSSSDINAARRAGAVVSTERKVVTNAGHVGEDFRRIAKLAETDEIIAPKAVSMDVGKAIGKARLEKKLSQKELGVLVNEKQTVVSYPFFFICCYFLSWKTVIVRWHIGIVYKVFSGMRSLMMCFFLPPYL